MAEVWTPPVFDDVATGELVTAAQLNAFGNSLRFLKEVYYQQFVATVSPTATTEATANTIVAGASQTYEAVPHLIQFFSPSVRPDTGAAGRVLHITLLDSATVVGELAQFQTPAAASSRTSCYAEHRLTPTAAAHTYNVRAWVNAGTGLVDAGAGGAGVLLPGFIRITRIPT